jgi:hypothetical protein
MKKSIVAIFLFMTICCFVFGCDKKAEPPKPAPPKEEAKPESMENKVTGMELDLAFLKIQVNNMSNGFANVSTEEKGYAIAQTKYGSFVVRCKNVTPYLDGYKVQIGIGNLTTAQFTGAKIHLVWGKDFINRKDMSVTNKFPPGRYTTIEVVLTPAKPEDIKTFTMNLDFDVLGLAD